MSNPFRDAGAPTGGFSAEEPAQYNSVQQNYQDSTGAHDWNFPGGANKDAMAQPAQKAAGIDQQNAALDDLLGLAPPQQQPASNQLPAQNQQQQQQPDPFDFGMQQPAGNQPGEVPAQPKPLGQQQSFDFFGDFGNGAGQKANQPVAQSANPGLGGEKSAFDDDPDADDCELGSDIDGNEDGNLGGALSGMGESQIKQSSRAPIGSNFDFGAGAVEEEKKQNPELGDLNADPMAAFLAADKGAGNPGLGASQQPEQSAFALDAEPAQQLQQQQQPVQQQQQRPKHPADVIEAHEAFPDTDIELISELYAQANRDKAVLYNMLMQMAGVDIPEEELRPAQPRVDPADEQRQQREAQAQAQAEAQAQQLRRVQNAGPVDHGHLTDQEIKDMQMAAAMQQREIQRAQQEQQQRRTMRQQLQQPPSRGRQGQNQAYYANHVQQRQQRNGLIDQDDEGNFQDVNLSEDGHGQQYKRPKRPKQEQEQGFLAKLFGGCCSTKEKKGSGGLEKRGERPVRKPPVKQPVQQREDPEELQLDSIDLGDDDGQDGSQARQQQPKRPRLPGQGQAPQQ